MRRLGLLLIPLLVLPLCGLAHATTEVTWYGHAAFKIKTPSGKVFLIDPWKEQMGFDTQGNFGGELTLLDDEVQIAFIPAVHSSTVVPPEGSADKDIHGGGNPGGFFIRIKVGETLKL